MFCHVYMAKRTRFLIFTFSPHLGSELWDGGRRTVIEKLYDAVGGRSLRSVWKIEIKVPRMEKNKRKGRRALLLLHSCTLLIGTPHSFVILMHYSSAEWETNRSLQHFIRILPERVSGVGAVNKVWQGINGVPEHVYVTIVTLYYRQIS